MANKEQSQHELGDQQNTGNGLNVPDESSSIPLWAVPILILGGLPSIGLGAFILYENFWNPNPMLEGGILLSIAFIIVGLALIGVGIAWLFSKF